MFEQLRLFAPENPLRSRFSAHFFKQVPRVSGVYWMLDHRDRIIYVGKAKNLRARLRSYRSPNFEEFPSHTQRMLRSVRAIHWRETENETAALLTENEMIRALKPRFNVAGTRSETYSYFSFKERLDGFQLRLSIGRPPCAKAPVYGAFRGLAGARRVQASLLRWLWVFLHGDCDWPARLYKPNAPLSAIVPWPASGADERLARIVDAYFSGFAPIPEMVLPLEVPPPFLQRLWRDDQIMLAQFFRNCQSLDELRARFEIRERPLSIEEVDDLRVVARARSHPSFDEFPDRGLDLFMVPK